MTSLGTFIEIFLQALIAGVLIGAIYGLMCVGLGIIFGVMRVINFAQGEFLMLGMYFTFYLVVGFNMLWFLGPIAGPYTGALLAGPALFAVAYALHRLLISRVTGTSVAGTEGEGHYAQLILTLGIALVLQNGGLILFGSTPQSVRTPLSARAWEIPLLYDANASLFLNKARAVAAVYMGIDVDRAYRIAFGIGIGITAIAGGLVATYNPFQPYIGLDFVIIMYAGVVLGGMGSILGAFWGGMTIGLVQQLSTLVLPTQLQNAAIFVVFLLIVMVRPQGLFGRMTERI